MADLKCELAGASCPYEHQIIAAYEKLITGNGDLPIIERVRNLEDEMATALPILQSLEKAADRQEGRDLERLNNEKLRDLERRNNEKLRDQRVQRFRFWITVFLTILSITSALYVGLRAVESMHKGTLTIPSIHTGRTVDRTFAAYHQLPVQAGINEAAEQHMR